MFSLRAEGVHDTLPLILFPGEMCKMYVDVSVWYVLKVGRPSRMIDQEELMAIS